MGQIRVACVAFTHIPELGGWVTICQERNDFNSEGPNGYKKQTFAGVFGPLFTEKAKDGEVMATTFIRGAREELGALAAATLQYLPASIVFSKEDEEGGTDIVFATMVPSTILGLIRSEVSGIPRIRTYSQIEEAVESTDGDRDGVQGGQMKFRPHHLAAMRKAWAWLDRQPPPEWLVV